MSKLPPVAIPTYKRHELISKLTLNFLRESDYPSDLITLFVADAEEAQLYRDSVPREMYGQIVIGMKGLKEQRGVISNLYTPGRIIIQMDDDVKKICIKIPFKDYVLKAVKMLEDTQGGLFGCLPKDDTRCYKDSHSEHLTHILGSFFICRNDPDLVITTTEKEDYERSILYFIKYGKVIRDRSGGVRTCYRKTAGGLQTSDRSDQMKQGAEYLATKYPEYCKKITKRGLPDLSLNWRATTSNQIPLSDFQPIIDHLNLKPVEVNKYRPNVGEGRSQCYGIVGRRCLAPDISRQSWRDAYLHNLLMEFAKKHIKIPFTSIQVNQNMTCAKHKDKGNIGVSAIVAFGDYQGGDLVVEDKQININRRIHLFDGSQQEHYTAPFTGNRYSIVYHTIAPQERFQNKVPAITEYEAVQDGQQWKIKRLSDNTLFWGNNGLPHPLKGRRH